MFKTITAESHLSSLNHKTVDDDGVLLQYETLGNPDLYHSGYVSAFKFAQNVTLILSSRLLSTEQVWIVAKSIYQTELTECRGRGLETGRWGPAHFTLGTTVWQR